MMAWPSLTTRLWLFYDDDDYNDVDDDDDYGGLISSELTLKEILKEILCL